jgi:hypothetical protein
MSLLDRYLASVRSALPEAQRDDIVNELSENLRSQIEDQESSLGRPLTDAELDAMLKKHGHPLIVAARYHLEQRSLSFGREIVGPVLFPFYLKVLKFNLGITSIVILVVLTALFFSGHVVTAGSIFTALCYQVLIQFAIVTFIFSIADRHWKKHPDQWDPRYVKHIWHPAFTMEGQTKRPATGDSSRVSRFDSVAQVIALCIALVWLRIAQGAPFLIFGPAAAFLRPAPIWHQFYWPVVALAFLGILQGLVNLVRPDWLRFMVAFRAIAAIAWIVILVFVLKAGHWVVLAPDAAQAEGFRHTAEILNQLTVYGVAGLTAAAIYNLIRHLRRLIRLSRPKPFSSPATQTK